jgi:ParB family transcriptional regulator, chromosome partitioning protein
MPPVKKGLGRGLDALLGSDTALAAGDRSATLPVSQLVRGKYQPRAKMDQASLEELAASIRAQGVLSPILVRPIGSERFEIIAGERRFRAAQLASLKEVPVLVREVDDHAAAAMALIENIQREDLNPLEEAQGIARLINDFKLTQEAAAQAVGRSRSAVANLLRLMQLPESIQTMLLAGELDMGHARALLALDTADQAAVAQTVRTRGLSVRDTEDLVRKTLETPSTGSAKTPAKSATASVKRSRDLIRLEEDVAEKLGTRVDIAPAKRGGKVVLHYTDNEHLSDLLARIAP